ncbi:MAG: plasmid pRiA4b ORF-3 family protein [Thermodesulfobacteriota bacterium]
MHLAVPARFGGGVTVLLIFQGITYSTRWDDWQHEIVVEKISRADPEGLYPVCLEGERASPVEDCGGVTGYYDLLETIQDPEHEEHESMVRWACRDGVDYDPEECNLKSINRELRFYWPKGRRWSYPLAMSLVNRYVVIIRPKEPFLQWLKNTPDWDLDMTLQDLRTECTSILIPEFEDSEKTEAFMEHIYETIFEMKLDDWYRDETAWPQERSYELLRKWFDIEVHSTVIDLLDEEIEKESF